MKTNWDLIENRIKIENRFRLDVTDYISKMYKTRKNSILPYDINTEYVFEMLQDLTWTSDDKFVVFFNFEFIMCLMKLGVTPNKITYVAPSKESFYVVRDGGWGERGMKSILFDLSIYKRYQNRKQWKSHLMKKIGKLNEFIGVGNVPFTLNDSDSDNSKKIGNDFIKLMNQFKKSCYILPFKYHSKTFNEQLIYNESLQKIVYHDRKLFDIAGDVYTCHVLIDNENKTNNFIYTNNTTSGIKVFDKDKNISLSKNIDLSGYFDSSVGTLGDIWTMGKSNRQDLKSSGKYKVVSKVGKNDGTDNFEYLYSDEETTSLGLWKVIVAKTSGGVACKIASPDFSIGHSIVGFIVKDKISAEKLKSYLQSDLIVSLWKSLKTNNDNTKSVFLKIPLPDGII
jgi:hypothetical protein